MILDNRCAHHAKQIRTRLCGEHSNSWTVKKLYKALNADHGEVADIQQFLTAKLRQARAGIPNWYAKESPKSLKYPLQYWQEVRIEAMITVPCMWDARSECVMRNAATDAGFENVQLLLEPLCAAALDIHLLLEAGCLKYGSVITWHDIGCATNDFATVRINKPETPGGLPQLEIVGSRTGHLLGAHLVNDMAFEYVQEYIKSSGGMQGTLLRLGRMSKEELSRQVSAEIEIRKKIHPVVDFSITITAMADWQMNPDGVPHLSIRIKEDRMLGWLEAWTSLLIESEVRYLADPQQHAVRAVVRTGGGSKNATARAGFQASTAKMGIQMFDSPSILPVACGGLRQYPQRKINALPEEGYWFITRSAEFDEEWHCDVVRDWKHVQELKVTSPEDYDIVDEVRMVPLAVPALVTQSKIDKKSWTVHDRLTPILSRRKGVSTTYNVPMFFYLDADSPSRLNFDVYHSNTAHEDQEPLRDNSGVVHPEFTAIQMTFADIPSLEEAGFKEEQHGKDYFFHLHALTTMRCRDDHLELEIFLFAAGEELSYIEGEGK